MGSLYKFINNSLLSLSVQEALKSVNIWQQSYEKVGPIVAAFCGTVYIVCCGSLSFSLVVVS